MDNNGLTKALCTESPAPLSPCPVHEFVQSENALSRNGREVVQATIRFHVRNVTMKMFVVCVVVVDQLPYLNVDRHEPLIPSQIYFLPQHHLPALTHIDSHVFSEIMGGSRGSPLN